MKTTGRVNGIISNIVIVKADGPVGQNEICHVYCGDTKMMAEVIKVVGDNAYVQVFDSTRGLKIGEKVEFEGHMLEATLAPGLLSRNYDGLQNDLEKMDGLFIARGSITDPIDFEKKWEFKPLAKPATRFRPHRGWARSRRSGSSTRSWYPSRWREPIRSRASCPPESTRLRTRSPSSPMPTVGITILRWFSGGP